MHKVIKVIPFSTKYQTIMESVYEASEHAKDGGNCAEFSW